MIVGFEYRHGYQFGQIGYPLNEDKQPVVRISWNEAMEFCEWLSKETGQNVSLPSEAQWEWSCRAGTNTDFWFGNIGDDFSKFANMADQKLEEFAACTAYKSYESIRIIDNPNKYDEWIPRDTTYNDFGLVSENVGRYRRSLWELYDMHGNVWEWTQSEYKSYPYKESIDNEPGNQKVVRGGSWYTRPEKCTSSYRLSYLKYQNIFDVGFRIVVSE